MFGLCIIHTCSLQRVFYQDTCWDFYSVQLQYLGFQLCPSSVLRNLTLLSFKSWEIDFHLQYLGFLFCPISVLGNLILSSFSSWAFTLSSIFTWKFTSVWLLLCPPSVLWEFDSNQLQFLGISIVHYFHLGICLYLASVPGIFNFVQLQYLDYLTLSSFSNWDFNIF